VGLLGRRDGQSVDIIHFRHLIASTEGELKSNLVLQFLCHVLVALCIPGDINRVFRFRFWFRLFRFLYRLFTICREKTVDLRFVQEVSKTSRMGNSVQV